MKSQTSAEMNANTNRPDHRSCYKYSNKQRIPDAQG